VSGSDVIAWQDQSGNGNHLTAVGDPQHKPNALQGNSAVSFDGVDDSMVRYGFTGWSTAAEDRAVFAVVRYNAANMNGSGWVGFAYGTAASNQAFGLALTPSGTLGVQGWGGANDQESNPAINGIGEWISHAAVYSGGTIMQFKNGG